MLLYDIRDASVYLIIWYLILAPCRVSIDDIPLPISVTSSQPVGGFLVTCTYTAKHLIRFFCLNYRCKIYLFKEKFVTVSLILLLPVVLFYSYIHPMFYIFWRCGLGEICHTLNAYWPSEQHCYTIDWSLPSTASNPDWKCYPRNSICFESTVMSLAFSL